MHTDRAPKEKPTGSANYPAGHTDNVIVPDAVRPIKAALLHLAAWLAVMVRGARMKCSTRSDSNNAAGERPDKAFATLAAGFALVGHALHRIHPDDGPVTNFAQRWGLVRHLASLEDARRLLTQIGGAP